MVGNSRCSELTNIGNKMNYKESKLRTETIKSYFEVLKQDSRNIKVPNLIGLGSPRCGTSTLYKLLSDRDDCYCSPVKEANFWGIKQEGYNRDGWTVEEYKRLFLGGETFKYNADITPVYLHCIDSLEEIRKNTNDVKVIINIRNPIDRLFSQFKHFSEIGRSRMRHDFNNDEFELFLTEGIKKFKENKVKIRDWSCPGKAITQSLYNDYILKCEELFGQENVLVLLYEDLKVSQDIWQQTLNDFLGDELSGLESQTSIFHANKSKVMEMNLEQETLSELFDIFDKDIEPLSKTIGRDLASIWKII